MIPLLLFLIISQISIIQCQFASIFDRAQRASNCETWSEWGNCIWMKGQKSRNRTGYFDQMSEECKRNSFFRTTKENYQKAINNVYTYLRNITKDNEACGLCSYRQSCGSVCTTKQPGAAYVNKIFVAEERCNEQQLDGNDQLTACYDDYYKVPKENKECQIWPNRNIPLPNVSDLYKAFLYNIPLVNCVKAMDDKNEPVCRCCCAPYVPSPEHKYLCLNPKKP